MKMTKTMMISMLVGLLVCTTGAMADTLVLQDGLNGYDGTDDNMLNWYNQTLGTINNGAFLATQVGNGYLSDPVNSLLRFSGLDVLLNGYISIDSATLTLTQSNDASPTAPMTGTVFPLADANAGWVEGVGNWEPALDGESTGYYKAYDAVTPANSTPWAGSYGADTAGVDYGAALAVFSIAPFQAIGTSYDIPLPTSIIEQWINGTNAGLLIKDDPRQGNAPDYQSWLYHSSVSATAEGRPMLTIEYTIPEPMTMSLLALGGLAMLRRRRK